MTTDDPTLQPEPAAYWAQSSRPLVSLVFVAPMLILYELGVLSLGPSAIRNGADVWLRQLLDIAGFGQYFLLPLLTCGLLLAWHHARHEPWSISNRAVRLMWLESAGIALALLIVAHVEAQFIGEAAAIDAATASVGRMPARLIGYLGAGIYEELLFRLLMLPACAAALRGIGLNQRGSWSAAVVATSVLFAAAHYQFDFDLLGWRLANPHGDSFGWFSFVFRCSAGGLFGALFVKRGFGIAAGTHALYDVLVAFA